MELALLVVLALFLTHLVRPSAQGRLDADLVALAATQRHEHLTTWLQRTIREAAHAYLQAAGKDALERALNMPGR